MRIVQCADYGGRHRGTFVAMLSALVDEAARRGHETALVLPASTRGRPWVADFAGRCPVHLVPEATGRLRRTRSATGAVRSLLGARPGPTVLHSHFVTYDLPTLMAAAGHPEVAVLWHEHGPLPSDARARVRGAIRHGLLGRAVDRRLPVSAELRSELLLRGARPARTVTFENAIDLAAFSPARGSERRAARAEIGLDPQAKVIVHLGWDWERKGGPLMLSAARRLRDDPRIRLLCVGAPAHAAAAIAAEPNVISLALREDIRTVYAASDALLCASRAEGLPLAVLEALAMGLGVVSTDLPVMSELLHGLPVAQTVSPDPVAVAAGVRTVLNASQESRAAHLARSAARLEDGHALSSWAVRLVALYEVLIAERA